LTSDGIGDQIEKSETRFSHFGIFLVHQNFVNFFHNWHNVGIVEKLAVLVLRLTESIGYLSQNI